MSALSFFSLCSISHVHAQTADELQQKIDQRNKDIAALQAEIRSYQKEISTLGDKANTLTTTIAELDITAKKLAAHIRLTENQIIARQLEIQKLSHEIRNKTGAIDDDKRIIRQSFMTIAEAGTISIPEIILTSKSASEGLANVDRIASLQSGLYNRITGLNADKTSLETARAASQKAAADLAALKRQLNDQKTVNASAATDRRQLLATTHASQASYEQLLADKQAQEAALDQEIQSFESQLHLLVSASQIPHTGSGVLAWPLDSIVITQYFGNTPFATANPQIYNGKGHTGVDFRATIGTPVKAALSGVVVGVADTDQYPGCYSYGKWIMIKHTNGLSTLYAHLSLQTVHPGDQVSTGQIVGYSGNTGYTTGPHLHFGVYATDGVVIKQFTSSQHCRGATIPIADFSAYLNPLSYL